MLSFMWQASQMRETSSAAVPMRIFCSWCASLFEKSLSKVKPSVRPKVQLLFFFMLGSTHLMWWVTGSMKLPKLQQPLAQPSVALRAAWCLQTMPLQKTSRPKTLRIPGPTKAGGQKFQPHLHRVLFHPPGEATIKLEKSFNEKRAGISIKTIWYYTYIHIRIYEIIMCVYIYIYTITLTYDVFSLYHPTSLAEKWKIEYLRIEQITRFFLLWICL